MEELSLVKQDINEKERDRLFHQIVQLEHEEDELRNLKKRREQSLENFIEQFRNISINAEQRLSVNLQNQRFIQETRELELKVEQYVNNQIDGFDYEAKKLLKDIDMKKEKLIHERNGFDRETSEQIANISRLIDEKFPNLSQSERDQLLLVTLGSFVYTEGQQNANTTFDKIIGFLSDTSWTLVMTTIKQTWMR